jgi:hypothetical protein
MIWAYIYKKILFRKFLIICCSARNAFFRGWCLVYSDIWRISSVSVGYFGICPFLDMEILFSIVGVVIVVTIIIVIILSYQMCSSWYFSSWTSGEPHQSDFKMVVLSLISCDAANISIEYFTILLPVSFKSLSYNSCGTSDYQYDRAFDICHHYQ